MRLPLLLRAFLIFTMGMILFFSLSYGSDQIVKRKGFTPVGEIVFIAGKVVIRLIPGEDDQPAITGQKLIAGDIIKTGDDIKTEDAD